MKLPWATCHGLRKVVSFDEQKPEKLIDRFKEAARELGCDESEVAFDEKLGSWPGTKQKTKSRTERKNRWNDTSA